jgi:hypothetical protein
LKSSVNENRTNQEQIKRLRHNNDPLTIGTGSNSIASSSNNNETSSLINLQTGSLELNSLSPIIAFNQRTEALLNFIQNDLPTFEPESSINNSINLLNIPTYSSNNNNINNNNSKNNTATSNNEAKNSSSNNDSSQSPRCPICLENLQEVMRLILYSHGNLPYPRKFLLPKSIKNVVVLS